MVGTGSNETISIRIKYTLPLVEHIIPTNSRSREAAAFYLPVERSSCRLQAREKSCFQLYTVMT